jgi:rhodanese-related sulfurtransferase/DNA-binding transcriptional ArsR family regulator
MAFGIYNSSNQLKNGKSMTSSNRQFKDSLYEQLARIGKALASPIRLELLDVLSQGPRTVESIANEVNQSVANTSQHLQILRSARVIESERNGVNIIYRLADQEVLGLCGALRRVGEARLLEVRQVTEAFLRERGALERTDNETLLERVRRGEVTVLDVRPTDEFLAGHIPGAISVPLSELEQKMADLPPDREIVAYCRGPLCVMSIEAVNRLNEKGYQATRWEEGVADWVARGFAIQTGAV